MYIQFMLELIYSLHLIISYNGHRGKGNKRESREDGGEVCVGEGPRRYVCVLGLGFGSGSS